MCIIYLVQLIQGEDICAAVVREVKEETGVSILIVSTINCNTMPKVQSYTHGNI